MTNTDAMRRRKLPPVQVLLMEHATFQVRRIPKEQLIIPIDEYQRDESAGIIARDIALHFNPVAFGALTVIERAAGNGGGPVLLVADGGTRLSAARMRPDISEVLCLVFGNLTKEQEADTFLAINQNRRKLRVEQLQHSEVFAGREHAIRVDDILLGFRRHRISFNALSALRACVRRMPNETATIERILHQVAQDKHVGVRVFKGLVYLERAMRKRHRTLDDRARVAKLDAKFGELESSLNAALSLQGSRSSDPASCARAIAKHIGIQFPQDHA